MLPPGKGIGRLVSSPAVSPTRLEQLLLPFYPDLTDALSQSLSLYLDLLLRWNARMNLTAIRDPEEIVRRHFGESLFVARHLPACETLLDLGSGAGFPGIPIQLALPQLAVTLGEAQRKKASFLQEAVRILALPAEVWPGRVEAMPEERLFDVVTMRAVDHPEKAALVARRRLKSKGLLAVLATDPLATGTAGPLYRLPDSERSVLQFYT